MSGSSEPSAVDRTAPPAFSMLEVALESISSLHSCQVRGLVLKSTQRATRKTPTREAFSLATYPPRTIKPFSDTLVRAQKEPIKRSGDSDGREGAAEGVKVGAHYRLALELFRCSERRPLVRESSVRTVSSESASSHARSSGTINNEGTLREPIV